MNGSIPYIYMPNPIYIMLNYLSSTILFFYLLRIYIILYSTSCMHIFFIIIILFHNDAYYSWYCAIILYFSCISLAAIKNNIIIPLNSIY